MLSLQEGLDARFVRLVTNDGTVVTGRLLNQDAISVQLMTPKEELKTYIRANLREYAIVDKGLMPSVEGTLTVQQVADLEARAKPVRILRVNRERAAQIGAEPRGVALGAAKTLATAELDQLGLPAGMHWEVAGQGKELALRRD